MKATPVWRENASRYVLFMVVSFAATVIITRTYLELTGYPQIGGGELHIAHLLWGGLALFIGGLLPLIFANRRVFDWAALLSGVGVGLFIDEVGKFITKTNDYFYPAAAPIIYGVFLLTVLLYFEIRRRRDVSPRARFYAVLDQLPVVIDQNITPEELATLTGNLQQIAAQKSNPTLARLSANMLDFLNAENLNVVQKAPSWWERLWVKSRSLWKKHITRGRHRLLLVLGLALPELISLLELALLLLIVMFPAQISQLWAQVIFTSGQLDSLNDLTWFAIRFWLDGLTGLLAIAGAVLLLVGKERQGVSLGVMALVLSLTVNNLLTFYQDQFQALAYTLVQGLVLLLAVTYRRWYLENCGTQQL
ncbi:MAG: hypothetical protein Kow0031_13990 [Anaerolineae bacterium]